MNNRQTADNGVKNHYENQSNGAAVLSQPSQSERSHNLTFAAALERVEARLKGKKISASKLTALAHEEMNKA